MQPKNDFTLILGRARNLLGAKKQYRGMAASSTHTRSVGLGDGRHEDARRELESCTRAQTPRDTTFMPAKQPSLSTQRSVRRKETLCTFLSCFG